MQASRGNRAGRFLYYKQLSHCRCEIRLKISICVLLLALIYGYISNRYNSPAPTDTSLPIKSDNRPNSIGAELPASFEGGFDPSSGMHFRQLLQIGEFEKPACTPRAINNYPSDFLTMEQRRHGAILIHLFIALYTFLAVAIVCDDYFVKSLEQICEKLELQEDVAGKFPL